MKKSFLRFFTTVLATAALASAFFTTAYADIPDRSDTLECQPGDSVAYYLMPYMIVKGDTISDIYHCWGLRYENYADDICALNGLTDLDKVQAGWLLYLPTDAANLMGSDYTTVIAHTMKAGETAYDVCRSYDMDLDACEERMELYNSTLDLAKLKAGQTLHIPLR